ncbi:glycosyltransferase family 39 protein [Paenibacillus sp. LHD-117]|uniref:ArnT family glycosyltransferase n=1 Tax=Paenibacillus sp. LHD-117 TaxID=3071412 RepID=UPI0027E041E3|nr:glycosyltransferase family 39 protein [Paenibacillus sp. LHD-117]MDQ6420357.1 glycosyltransferase family 39 protein [Paenibacillus sp. LHD-117]
MKEALKSSLGWIRRNPLLILLFAVGALVRLWYGGVIPPGLNQDEASVGYDAYAILHYGIDRNGASLPVHLIAWGSGQNALYAYFSMPFIYLFGLNVWSVRAVSMLFGLIGMAAMYGIGRRMFDSRKGVLLALFLTAICPWHIMMSRWGLESNLFPTLALLAVYFLLLGLEKPKWLYGSTIMLALSLYAYGTAYFFVPVFTVAAATYLWATKRVKPAILLLQAALLAVLSLPILLFLYINKAGKEAIVTPFFTIPKLTVPRVEQVSALFSDGLAEGIALRANKLLELLLSQDDGLPWNAIPDYGYIYPLGIPFIAIGIGVVAAKMFKNKSAPHAIVCLWFAAALLMALIMDINMNRINVIFYPILLLGSAGLVWFGEWIRDSLKIVLPAFVMLFALFGWHYFTKYPDEIGPTFYESFGEAVRYASGETDGPIAVTGAVNMPYIYVLFYERVDPRSFVDTVTYSNPGAPFQQVRSFGRYTFGDAAPVRGRAAAYVLHNSELPPAAILEGYEIRRFKNFSVLTEKASNSL